MVIRKSFYMVINDSRIPDIASFPLVMKVDTAGLPIFIVIKQRDEKEYKERLKKQGYLPLRIMPEDLEYFIGKSMNDVLFKKGKDG